MLGFENRSFSSVVYISQVISVQTEYKRDSWGVGRHIVTCGTEQFSSMRSVSIQGDRSYRLQCTAASHDYHICDVGAGGEWCGIGRCNRDAMPCTLIFMSRKSRHEAEQKELSQLKGYQLDDPGYAPISNVASSEQYLFFVLRKVKSQSIRL